MSRPEIRPQASPDLAAWLLGFAGVVIFGATLPVTRIALEGYGPWFITFSRALLATAAAASALAAMRARFPRADAVTLFSAGIMLVFGFPGFMALAMQTVPASHGGVVLGILPLATAAFAALVAGERMKPAFWFWAVAGTVLVVAFAVRDSGFGFAIGDLWLVLAGLCASLGYVISGKLTRKLPGWQVISWALVLTLPVSLAGTVLLWSTGIRAPSAAEHAALAYLGLGSMYAGFLFWNVALARGGIARIGQVQLLQIFVTLAFSALLLGEPLGPEILLFAAAVAACVWMGRRAG